MRSKYRWPLAAAAFLLWVVGASVGFAEPGPAAPPGPPAAPPASQPPGTPAPAKPDFPPFEEAMKDFQEVPTSEPPFIPLWYNKKEDALRAQVPAALIGKQFLVATSMSGGPVATGFQLDHFLAYFDRMDKRLVLMRVDPRYADGGNKPIADVIKRSYGGDIILRAINIVTLKGPDLIIDLDGVFKADFAGVGPMGGGNVVPALSKWVKYKAFPENVELSVDLAMMRGESGRRNLFHYSISKIPESAQGYQPRVADDRIGYFLTVRKDWSKEYDSDTLFDRYINRWRLEKRDPSLELSAPKNPIVWYIEKTVPLKYRRWVKEGILEWNRAYEKCGFLDAVEVIQQEDYDPRTKDLDPEDVRYNFFRWIVTGRGFAMGPSRAHPITGQIFDADIVFDDSMVRYYLSAYEQFTGGGQSWEPRSPVVQDFYKSNPLWTYRSPVELLLPNVKLAEDPDQVFYENLLRHVQANGQCLCEFAAGMAHELNFACVALEAKGIAPDSEEFIGQILKEVVCHEVGHCLGLRHNFKASTWLPMAEIIEQNTPGEANVGSIMDYNPPLIVARGEKQGSYITRSIGPYDYWAIEYGYRPVGKPYKDEPEMLQKIATRCAEAGLEYGTDEDTLPPISPDPLCNRFDMGRDVMDFARHQTELADSLLKDVKDWAVKDGQPYYKLRRAVAVLLSQRANASSYVTRFPGGLIMSRDHKADPNGRAPVRVVDAKDQRRAVRFICEKVFAEDAYQISPDLLNRLGAGRWSHWDSDTFDFMVEFNIHEFVARAQYNCLVGLMNPFTIRRIHDNQLRFGEGESVYTLAEHVDSITRAIWSELNDEDRDATESKPFINSFRRNLQRQHLGILMSMVLNPPGGNVPADANAIARQCVQYVLNKISKLKDAKLDTTSRAHLNDVQTRITKALNAEYRIGDFGGDIFHELPLRVPSDDEKTIPVLPKE
jgi:hypothetical protein